MNILLSFRRMQAHSATFVVQFVLANGHHADLDGLVPDTPAAYQHDVQR